jgi:serine phosphatase RsbU (regulator of sigma subunit)
VVRLPVADLADLGLVDAVTCAAALRTASGRSSSMEEAAAAVVTSLRQFFLDPVTGDPQLVLARMFSTERLADLPADLQQVATAALDEPAGPDLRCLTLLGTDGDLPAWRDRHLSVGHQAIPLPSVGAVRRAPMIAALVSELGLDLESVVTGEAGDHADFGVFLVEHAAASPRLPDQEFVREYDVTSVLGFGAQLPSGQVFAVVLFSRVPVGRDTADLFRIIAVSVQLAMLEFADAPLFDGQQVRLVDGVEMTMARLGALEQLLEVHEKTAADQTGRLEHSVRQLRRQDVRLRREAEIIETLHHVGALLSAQLELDPLVQLATDAVVEVTGAQFGAFFYNAAADGHEAYLLYTVSGVDRALFDQFPMPRASALFGPTLSGDQVVRSDDILADPRYGLSPPFHGLPPGHLPVRSYLAVPVVTKDGSVEGGLFLGHADVAVFDYRAERLVTGIAAQTAAGLDNARLYRRERDTALLLQRQLLPRELIEVATLEATHRYIPGAAGVEVGGDWYDIIGLPRGRAALVIGDVMGRGVRAAATMGQLRTAIRAFATLDLEPADVLTHLNELVLQLTDEQIVTCVYALFDPADGSLVLANAGHPPAVVIATDGTVNTVPTALDPPLGVIATIYGQHQMHLTYGDALLLYTDGLVENRQRSADEGLTELCALLEADGNGARDPESLLDLLLGTLTQGSEHDDDVAMLLVRTT